MPGMRGQNRVPGTDARTRRNWNNNATAFEARALGDGIELEKDNTTNPSLNNRLRIAIDADKGLQFISGEIGIDIPTDGALALSSADGLQVDIAGMAAQATPAEADSFLLEDSGGSDAKEHVTLAELRTAVIAPPADGGLKNTTSAFEVDIAGMAAQASPAEADSFLLEDSGGTDAKEHVTLAELRAAVITPPADGGLKNTTSAFEVDIAGMAALSSPDDLDVMLIEDVTGDAKKKTTWAELKGLVSGLWTFPADGAIKKTGSEYQVDISGMVALANPDDLDLLLLEDVSGDGKFKITVGELKTEIGAAAPTTFDADAALKSSGTPNLEVDISGMAAQATPAELDLFLLEDTGGSDAKEKTTLAELRTAVIAPPADGAIKNTTSAFEVDIAGMAANSTPAEADSFLLEDSGGTDAKEHVTLAELRPAIITAGGGLKNTAAAFEVDIQNLDNIVIAEQDNFLVEDLTDSTKKRMTLANLRNKVINPPSDGAIKNTNEAFEVDISGMAAQGTPADADMFLLEDSGGSDAKEKVTATQLRVSMGNPLAFRTQTGAGSAVPATDKIIICDSSSDFIVTLPASTSAIIGVTFYIKNIGSNVVIVKPHIDDNPIVDIEGGAVNLPKWASVTITSNGTRWYIL